MNSDRAVQKICNFPADFRSGNRSAYDLVRESGIGQRSLTVESVIPVLRSNPHLVDDWMCWSEDQRCTPAYHFLEKDGKFVVGRLPEDTRIEFDDRFSACADFIVKAVDLIW